MNERAVNLHHHPSVSFRLGPWASLPKVQRNPESLSLDELFSLLPDPLPRGNCQNSEPRMSSDSQRGIQTGYRPMRRSGLSWGGEGGS